MNAQLLILVHTNTCCTRTFTSVLPIDRGIPNTAPDGVQFAGKQNCNHISSGYLRGNQCSSFGFAHIASDWFMYFCLPRATGVSAHYLRYYCICTQQSGSSRRKVAVFSRFCCILVYRVISWAVFSFWCHFYFFPNTDLRHPMRARDPGMLFAVTQT